MTIDADALVPPPGDLLIEGAGGALVPVTRTLLYADLFARWQIPVIVCARTALGTICLLYTSMPWIAKNKLVDKAKN